ncbi:GAI protein [Cohnella sp. CFH 77786]|uniref:GRAS family protein n=1 Tax=Cohnella sp. CFH 77786 TaxID=2662265 RepID=UPI001C61036F|nr:GRAS family protein [Cohnella sp. CFH 77786]MBW5447027.1 GAI protein [Cohnella sp. CFH 77786]
MSLLQVAPYDRLHSLLLEPGNAGETDAPAKLSRFAEGLEIAKHPGDLLPYLFAKSMLKRVNPEQHEQMNLYLRQHDIPQITLFNLLAQKIPFVAHAAPLANGLLARYIHSDADISFLEVGIGTGRQIVSLLQELHRQGKRPATFTLHAIEPNQDCLQQAQRNVMQAASSCGIRVVFHPIPYEIERMPDEAWKRIAAGSGSLLVNAAFALHHIRDMEGGSAAKDEVLSKIRSLRPAILVMCEPDSDHQTSDRMSRFNNCWRHFSAVFEFIDKLDLLPEHNRALKIFFGREIEDIIANPEHTRCERHESTTNWITRLKKAGFSSCPDSESLTRHHLQDVTVTSGQWHIGLGTGDINLVSVISAVSN